MQKTSLPNPKNLTDEQLSMLVQTAQAEQAERERFAKDARTFAGGFEARMQSLQSRFAAASTTPVTTPTNGTHKAPVAKAPIAAKPAVKVKAKGKAKRKKGPQPIKYRDPENPKNKWSGMGPQPDWLKAGIAAGKTLENYATAQG